MTTSIDIARELLLIWISGTHGDGAIAELRRRFPQATTAELQRACQSGLIRSISTLRMRKKHARTPVRRLI
jgi:hypothetical protein